MRRVEEQKGHNTFFRSRSDVPSIQLSGGHMKGDRDEVRTAIHRRMEPLKGAEILAARHSSHSVQTPSNRVFHRVDMRHGAEVLMDLTARGRKVEPLASKPAVQERALPPEIKHFESTSVRSSSSPNPSTALPMITTPPAPTREVSREREPQPATPAVVAPSTPTPEKPQPPMVKENAAPLAPVATLPSHNSLAVTLSEPQRAAPVPETAQPLMKTPDPVPNVASTPPKIVEVASASPVVESKKQPPSGEKAVEPPVQKAPQMTPVLRSLVDVVNNSSLQDAPRSPKETPKKELSNKDHDILMEMLLDPKVKTELLGYSNSQLMAAFSELSDGRIKYFESWLKINHTNAKTFPKFALESGITPQDTERLGQVVELLHQVSSARHAAVGIGR